MSERTIPIKALALISGGLDSALAIKLVQEQGVEVIALHVFNVFDRDDSTEGARAVHTARKLGVKLVTAWREQDYIDLIRTPNHGFGSGANPCVDCRIHLFSMAKRIMDEQGASFLVTGEVQGQRPMSQMKQQIELINRKTGIADLILRPLSAKLFEPTLPEREGWVDRSRLLDIQGRSRKRQLALAKDYDLLDVPSGGGGCLLTDPIYSKKVFDLYEHRPKLIRSDFLLLTIGRHFRSDDGTKLVVGRNAAENDELETLLEGERHLMTPKNFSGPSVMIDGEAGKSAIDAALVLMRAYSKPKDDQDPADFVVELRSSADATPVELSLDWRLVALDCLDAWRVPA